MRSGIITFTPEELFWLAGLFEGEGSFYKGYSNTSSSPIVSITMTDEDVIQRIAQALGISAISYESRNGFAGANAKRRHKASMVGQAAVSFMQLLMPHMSSRRQEQIERATSAFAPKIKFPHRQYLLLEASNERSALYWLAGILEGEGSFENTRSWGEYIYPKVVIGSTDLDVVERVQKYWSELYGGRQKINSAQTLIKSGKTFHRIWMRGRAAARQMRDIYPILGHRRQSTIRTILADKLPEI